MAVPWPPSLAQCIQRRSFASSEDPNIKIRTQMQTGAQKVRLRYTGVVTPYQVSLWMTREEYNTTFLTFYRDDLAHGVLSFDALNPLTMQQEEFRWVNQPSVGFIGWDEVQVSGTWEQLP